VFAESRQQIHECYFSFYIFGVRRYQKSNFDWGNSSQSYKNAFWTQKSFGGFRWTCGGSVFKVKVLFNLEFIL
jgi:hypothetical protein